MAGQEITTTILHALRYRFPTIESAQAEIAHLRSVLTLPKGTVHVVSDVHGEFKKLEHILRNASGSLRPLVEKVFGNKLTKDEQIQLLNLIYYPRETFTYLSPTFVDEQARAVFVRLALMRELELLRILSSRYTLRHVERLFHQPFALVFRELLFATVTGRSEAYVNALLSPMIQQDHGLELLRTTSRLLRSLSVFEVVVAGDLGDRGPRIDRVIEALQHQPSVSITWGNHDAEWMGACLGQPALVATVLRNSLRYGRISQLEEGYGIPVEPVEQLARSIYGNDPVGRFHPKGEDIREPELLAKMQKAVAVMQFKLEGQTILRNPHFQMDDRNLLHRINLANQTVEISGKIYPLLDSMFPTIDWDDPYRLSETEALCIEYMTKAFYESSALWRDMNYVLDHGAMYLLRDEHVIFHGCTPVDEKGDFLGFLIDGVEYRGRALFEAIEKSVRRAFRTRTTKDLDLFYYLWAGPRSPLFGKDKMATFETYFVGDKETHKETKNPYFKLIHEKEFCKKVAKEMGADEEKALLVNGHVPVKLEQGESPVKQSGMAVTIDGAFSEAYGDRGYTLVIEDTRTYLAQHDHFESIREAIENGTDIIPTISDLRVHNQSLTVEQTSTGAWIREEITWLERLLEQLQERPLR